jgi:hypothetical protein
LATVCSLRVATTLESSSRVSLISGPELWRGLARAAWCMKSLANAEWAVNEDSPSTPSTTEDPSSAPGWMVWLDGLVVDERIADVWAPAGAFTDA